LRAISKQQLQKMHWKEKTLVLFWTKRVGKCKIPCAEKIATLPCFFTEDLTLKKSLKSGCIKSCFLISHFIFLHLSFAFVCLLCKITKFLLFIYFTCNLFLLLKNVTFENIIFSKECQSYKRKWSSRKFLNRPKLLKAFTEKFKFGEQQRTFKKSYHISKSLGCWLVLSLYCIVNFIRPSTFNIIS